MAEQRDIRGAGRPSGTPQAADAGRPLLGAQISTAGGFAPVPGRALAIGAEVVQTFSSNPRTWQTRSPGPDEMAELVEGLARHQMPVFFHTIYLINLASPDEGLRRNSAKALAHALALGSLAGAAGVVTHVGSHRGDGFERGCERASGAIAEALRLAEASLEAQGHDPVLPPLLLETAVGAGAILGAQLEQLAALLGVLSCGPAPQVAAEHAAGRSATGICLDTAHLFAAGYAVHDPAGLDALVDRLRSLELLDRVGLMHLNDSSAPFASNRDRHENPGDGLIGYEGLAGVVRHPAFARVPFVLEVPGADGRGPDAANIAVVKAMRAGRPRPPVRTERRAAPDPREGPLPGA
ncbi:MAG: deoxyribonuclease IV [Thermoleophilia bacterium]|nr:deoxyribonuclease IV [Thermoleophilia bacterium]